MFIVEQIANRIARVGRVCLAITTLALAAFATSAGAQSTDSRPAGVSSAWWTEVQRNIDASEYFVSWQGRTVLPDLPAAWQAPNRAHNFRSYFTERGIRVVRRTETTPSWEWGLALAGVGRDGGRTAAAPARLSVDRNRIELSRGLVTEWFVNTTEGIEQGFSIAARPPWNGAAGRGPLQVDLELTGTLRPVVAEDGQAITFFTGEGAAVLTYARLVACDDRGRTLGSRMEARAEGSLAVVRLVVDDADAVYPILIDPLATSPFWSAESNQAYAHYGQSVSGAGDINGDGYSDFVVGAPYYDNGQSDEGRIFVYAGSASAPYLLTTKESDIAGAHFGWSVATAGDVNNDGRADVVVGAPDAVTVSTTGGRAYVYTGSSASPYLNTHWVHDGEVAGDQYGFSVSTAGDVNGDGYSDVVVGVPGYDRYYGGNWFYDAGRIVVYHGSSLGLPASGSGAVSGGEEGERLGTSVSTAGDVSGDGYADIVVGSPYYYSGASGAIGRAQLFTGGAASGIGIEPAPYWSQSGEQANAGFGLAVGPAGDVNGDGYADLIVGAKYYAGATYANEGKAYVYRGPNPATLAPWMVAGGKVDAFLGQSVGLAGDVNGDGYADVIIGAYGYTNDLTKEGRAYVYCGSFTGLAASPCWTGEGNLSYADYGNAVGPAGDVNGDGYSDVIVGAWKYANPSTEEGAAFVYLGGPNGIAAASAWTPGYGSQSTAAGDVNGDGYADVLTFQAAGARVYTGAATGLGGGYYGTLSGDDSSFGESAATAGDVNGDGSDDIIIGEYLFDAGAVDSGKVFVYYGGSAGMDTFVDWTATGGYAYMWFGYAVASAGDRNGDGYGDVVIAAPRQATQKGHVYIANGSSTGLGTATFLVAGVEAEDCFGMSVAGAGDVNGDGRSDLVIGAPEYGCAGSNPDKYGYFEICYGGSTSCVSGPTDCRTLDARLGTSVAGAGDVNGDGYADIIVGAPGYNFGTGRACVYHGSATGLPDTANRIVGVNLDFGQTVAGAGDVNGDGYADVLIANDDHVYAWYGSSTGLGATESWSVAAAGGHTAPGGDVNGDGYADVIVGKSLYYGGGGRGVTLRPQQLRTDATPLAQLGMSNHPSAFAVRLLGRTFFGRSSVRLEGQAQPLGSAWSGGRFDSNYFDTNTSGVTITSPANVAQMSVYHWRERVGFHPVDVPWQSFSRWLTVPRQGWLEADLRTFVGDFDHDGHGTAADCSDSNATIWTNPGETRSSTWTNRTTLTWTAPADLGGTQALGYDTLRSTSASGFLSATCVETAGGDLTTVDAATPGAGQVFYYLIRADNGCNGAGSLGTDSHGAERLGVSCE